MLVTLTAVRDRKDILININHIRGVVEDVDGYSHILIGDEETDESLIRVKESLEEVKKMVNDLFMNQHINLSFWWDPHSEVIVG